VSVLSKDYKRRQEKEGKNETGLAIVLAEEVSDSSFHLEENICRSFYTYDYL